MTTATQVGHIIAVLHAGEAVRLTLRDRDGTDLTTAVYTAIPGDAYRLITVHLDAGPGHERVTTGRLSPAQLVGDLGLRLADGWTERHD